MILDYTVDRHNHNNGKEEIKKILTQMRVFSIEYGFVRLLDYKLYLDRMVVLMIVFLL